MGAAVGAGASRRPISALALALAVEPDAAAIPLAPSGLVMLLAGMSWTIVLFLLSYVTANIVPLLLTALAIGADDEDVPVDSGAEADDDLPVEAAAPAVALREPLVVVWPVPRGALASLVRVVKPADTVELLLGAAVALAVEFEACRVEEAPTIAPLILDTTPVPVVA